VTELFRRQAVDYQRQKFHGAIVLTRSPWGTAVTVFFCGVVLALLAFAATQGFARKESAAGVLTAGRRRAAPGRAAGRGRPRHERVAGRAVAQGEPVVRLSDGAVERDRRRRRRRSPNRCASAAPACSRSSDDQAVQTRAARGGARCAHREPAGRARPAEREIALQRERVRLVREVSARYPELVRSGAVSPVETPRRRPRSIDQEARLAALERARLSERGELAQLKADRAGLPLVAGREREQLRRDMQAIAQAQAETESHRESLVLAPQAGALAAVLVQPGQAVAAGQTLATLLPAGSVLEAELYVPTRAAGHLRPGMPVWLRSMRSRTRATARSRAACREVAQSAMTAREGDAVAPAPRRARPTMRRPIACASRSTLRPARDATLAWRPLLKAGMHVQASLVAERRTLLQWALEPLEALRVAAK
jgi:membrane fusion protein